MDKKTIAAGAACAALLGAWGAAENTALLRTAEYSVPLRGLPRTVQISDLHKRCFGTHQMRLLLEAGADHVALRERSGGTNAEKSRREP